MPVYHVKDAKTGLELDLRGDGGPPTDAELAQIFDSLTKQREPMRVPLGANGLPRVSSNVPDSGDGLSPLNRFVGSFANNSMLQRAAHPETLGDIGQLLLPNGAEQILSRMVAPTVAAASKYGGAAVDVATGYLPKWVRPALDTLSELKPSSWNSPLTVAGREARSIKANVTQGADMYSMPRAQTAPNHATSNVPYGHGEVPPITAEDRIDAILAEGEARGDLRRGRPGPNLPKTSAEFRQAHPLAETDAPAAAPPAESPSTPPPAPPESTPATPATAAQKRGRGNAPTPRKRGAPTPAATDAQASGEITLTKIEADQAQKWLDAGVSPDTVADRILTSRALTQKLGTATPDEAARESARMARDSARRSRRE